MAVLCLFLTGCGKSGTYLGNYFRMMGDVASNMTQKDTSSDDSSEVSVDENALKAPANFVVNEDGSFSFDAVENAQYYYVYVYADASTKDQSGISSKIEENGSASYSGNVTEFYNFSYGTWSIRAVAYPDYDNSDYKASPEAKAEYVVKGAVDVGNPEINYMWTVASNKLTISISGMNLGNTMYPEEVKVTLTNKADSGNVVSMDVEDTSSGTMTATTTECKADATYDVKVDMTWDENYVTNPTYSQEGAEAVTSGSQNLISGDFSYTSAIFNTMDFPHLKEGFDLANGGDAGYWYNTAASNNGSSGEEQAEDTDKNVYYEATPIAAQNGAKYSYDIVITSPAGGITATPKLSPGSATTTMIFGTLDLFEDGTFQMETEYQYIRTDAMNAAVYYVPDVICPGVWTDNGDGTADLSYDHEDAYETDFDIVQELTGKAKEATEAGLMDNSSNDMGGSSGGEGGGGWDVVPTSVTFDEGAESFAFTIGSQPYFETTANLAATPDDGAKYTYELANGDPNAPFASVMKLNLMEDGTAHLSVSAEGPISGAEVDGTWVSENGQITLNW